MNIGTVDENFSQLKTLLCTQLNFKSMINILRNLTLLMSSSENRQKLNRCHWEEVANLARIGSQILSKTNCVTEELEFVADVFRFLRNSCGGSSENQKLVLCTIDVFNFAKEPLHRLLQKESSAEITILKICIQLFGNILLCDDSSKPVVWGVFLGENAFKCLLMSKDQTVQEYTMMVLYNCMSEENSKYLLSAKEGHDVLIAVTNTLLGNSTDWGMLFMEYLLKKDEFLYCCYSSLPLENRLLILDLIIEHLKCGENEEDVFIPLTSIEYVKNLFLNHVKGISQLCSVNNSNIEPSETVKMLSLLCSASICNAYIPFMVSNKDLLEKCIETLKCIHLLGKQSGNAFSSICISKQTNSQFNEQVACHPLFGFKKDLIRLIGNLCYNCRENQDLVRNLDGIPLVLDCCKLDAKNPYIMQWCILAIRNMLEHNHENQAVLAEITMTGEIVDSSVLKEMGIQVCIKNGKLSIN